MPASAGKFAVVQKLKTRARASKAQLCRLANRFTSNTFYHWSSLRRFALGRSSAPLIYYPSSQAVSETIVTRAPTRIDFGGGWTDVPPYSDEMGGYVCNVAISRYVTVTVGEPDERNRASHTMSIADRSIAGAAARRFDFTADALRITSDFPLGAGLGGSSAAGVAVVSAMCAARGEEMSRTAIAELSREIEINDLGIAGGRQDHYAAAYGGALGLHFASDHVDVDAIPLSPELRAELERRCMVIYTGQSRISSDTIEAVLGAYRAKERRVLDALRRMKELARMMAASLRNGNVDELGRLVGEQWEHQRSLHPAIPTARIDEIIARAAASGAVGSKALGASGGGCVLVIAADDRCDEVRDVIAPLGAPLSFTIDECGATRCL
jgi:D-glycero-alpha-D-manno-heptose-7-phosphate kinase